MKPFLMRYATPLMTGLFLVSLISGIALFFHVGMGWFRGMHEWLSMVLVLPFVLHVWRNWRQMAGYFRRRSFALAIVVSLVAALGFAVSAGSGGQGGGGGRPQFALADLVMQGTVAEVAPLLDLSAADLAAGLAEAGYAIDNTDVSLTAIAAASGRTDSDLAAALVQQTR
ncbi:MAG: DUF4405 domain-containing protein [Rhodospirillaceae bacterium]|nr:DUF4405 domain-containing protein [Rhodospirillaceae bacterium]